MRYGECGKRYNGERSVPVDDVDRVADQFDSRSRGALMQSATEPSASACGGSALKIVTTLWLGYSRRGPRRRSEPRRRGPSKFLYP